MSKSESQDFYNDSQFVATSPNTFKRTITERFHNTRVTSTSSLFQDSKNFDDVSDPPATVSIEVTLTALAHIPFNTQKSVMLGATSEPLAQKSHGNCCGCKAKALKNEMQTALLIWSGEGPILFVVSVELTKLRGGRKDRTSNATIVLGSNQLSGPIPTLPTTLTTLDLSTNAFSGSIPTSLTQITGLTFLSLGANSLTGPIPTSITQLTSLTDLSLQSNKLSGGIPDGIGNMNILTLNLASNALTGQVPTSVCQKAYNTCDLSLNNLTSPIKCTTCLV
ncbi:4219_t:CDS:2 [Paraglomus occultum]|uniref:4219_t:CDS:1 n=1 Tax=Paraglomus occultum TaxID=144539 RepID=A0A9N9BSX9_9GLOM|nr:4219_t:CDS:2 [Paraglomus occultum]